MEFWLSAILGAQLIGVGLSLTDKYVVSRVAIRPYLLLIGVLGLLAIAVIPITGAPWPTLVQWMYGSMIGIIFSMVIYASFKAYQKEEVSRLAPLSILPTLIITAGAALFFDEHLSVQQYWAFALFLLGAVLLATRLETRFRFVEDIAQFRVEKLSKQAADILFTPIWQTSRTRKRIAKHMHGMLMTAYEAARNPSVTFVQRTKKLRLIKGLGWYMLALGLTIPYTLLSKQLSNAGVLTSFVTIRVGLCIGAVLIMIGNIDELFTFLKARKVVAIASTKELFGIAANFLTLAAYAAGPAGIISAMGSIGAVGVFLAGIVLAKLGVIRESLKRRDIIQKSVGVICIAVATVLLFR